MIKSKTKRNKRVDGCGWELVDVAVDLFVWFDDGRLSSFSKSLLNTWLRDKLMRRLRFVRLRSRKGFNEDDEVDRNIGNDSGWVSSVDAEEVGGRGGMDSVFIDYYYLERQNRWSIPIRYSLRIKKER